MNSPYVNGYGLKWPSSNIVSEIYRCMGAHKRLGRGLDFGCGLGAHGRLMETLGLSEVYYLDNDEYALKAAQKRLAELPFEGSRLFLQNLTEIPKNIRFDFVIDRASLQHVKPNLIHSVLLKLKDLLIIDEISGNMTSGFLLTEWILSSDRDVQTHRFPDITFFFEIESFVLEHFQVLSKSLQTTIRVAGEETTKVEIVNLTLTVKQI